MPEFLLPDLGEGLEEATIVSWLVDVGDEVTLNQPLCVVETAKAEVEVPSPFTGTVTAHGGDVGDTLAVGTLLARIGADEPAREPTLVGYGHDSSLDRSRRPLAKPPVRKLARDLNIDLTAIAPGSGPNGIVTGDDVRHAAATNSNAEEIVPVVGIRARVAEKMATSRASIPDATCSVVADCSRLLQVRAELNAAAERRGRPASVTPFSLLCRFAVLALGDSPRLNATFDETSPSIRMFRAVHLGIGTATDRGLVVTVVRDAQERGVHDLSTEMARLGDEARAGSLAPAELQGSTFTISNFGALGIDDGVPVINHPEAAILGVGSIKPRPHVVDDEVVARPTVSLTLVFDHRVCDGAEAGRYLRDLRELIEAPELALG